MRPDLAPGGELPLPTADQTDLARDRTKRVSRSLASGMVTRVVAAAAPVLTIPVVLAYLGEETFGVWMTIATLTALTAFADFGMGASLLTRLSPLVSKGRYSEARAFIVATYVALTAMAVTVTAAVWIARPALPWEWWLNAPETSQAGLIVAVTVTGFVVNIPASLITRVQQAAQEVSASNAWAAAAAALTVPMALLLVGLQVAAWVVVAGLVFTPVVVNILNALWFFVRRPELRPRIAEFTSRNVVDMAYGGRGYFVLSILLVAAVSFDNLIVAHALGAAAVTLLALPVRVFSQVGQVCTMLTIPLWAINGEALAHSDLTWIKRNVRRMTTYTLGLTIAACGVVVTAREPIFVDFLGLSTIPSVTLLLGLAAWWTVLSALSPRFMVLNAAGIVRIQVHGWLAFVALALPLKIWVVSSFGLEGIAWVAVLVYSITVLPAALLGYRRALELHTVVSPADEIAR